MSGQDSEHRVLNVINEKRVVDLASELITFRSSPGKESEVAQHLADYLEKSGMTVIMQQVEPGRVQPLATLEGHSEGASLLFNGHMDIDPIPREHEDPFEPVLREGYLHGAGLFNMKAGVTAMVVAATAIAEAGVDLVGSLYCNPVVGELQGGIGTFYSIDHGPKPDAVLIPEPTDLSLLLKHGGVLDLAITTLGRTAHISRKEGAPDAIRNMWKVQQALYEMDENRLWTFEPDLDLPRLPMMNIGSIVGGRGRDWDLHGPYDVADVCTLFVDTRVNSSQSIDSVKGDFMAVIEKVKESNPDLEYELHLPSSRPETQSNHDRIADVIGVYMPPFTMPENEYLVECICRHHDRITGKPPTRIVDDGNGRHRVVYAGTDAVHYWNLGIPAFCYGPGGARPTGYEHTHHPPVLVSQIVACAKVMALTALDICSMTRDEYASLRSAS